MTHLRRSDARGAVLAVLLAFAAHPAAAVEPLRMENALPVAPGRAGGPLYVAGELQWDRPELLEGRLRFVLRDARGERATVETDLIALATGVTRFRQLIPIPDDSNGFGMADLRVFFISDDARFDLGSIAVRLAQSGDWESIVLCAEPTHGAGPGDSRLLREEIAFGKAFEDPTEFSIQDYAPSLVAADFWEQPLAYCAFDAVMLPQEAFFRLTGRQLDAVSDWARAGGAVCVAAQGALDQKHADFLAGLFRDTDAGPFVRDEQGRLIEPEGAAQGILARRVGLGFAIVTFRPGDELDFDTPAWREAHARFWRLREEFVRARGDGKPILASTFEPTRRIWAATTNSPAGEIMPVDDGTRFWNVPAPSFGTAVAESLRPTEIRLLPGWFLLLILVGYVGLVGPVDYLLLGRLRMRKWTWLTFPAVTLAVTWGVVAAAEFYMSDNDHLRTLEIVDHDANGEPVRRTKLELLFRGSGEPVLNEIERGFFAPLDGAHFALPDYVAWNPGASPRPATAGNDAPTGPYAGSIPSRYAVAQLVSKWTPQVNRMFEIAPELDKPDLDWLKFEGEASTGNINLPDGRTGGFARIAARSDAALPSLLRAVYTDDPYGFGYAAAPGQQTARTPAVPFLSASVSAPEQERSRLQFQRSPLGLGRLDDLPFADTSQGTDQAIVVWVSDDAGNITVHRKLTKRPRDP